MSQVSICQASRRAGRDHTDHAVVAERVGQADLKREAIRTSLDFATCAFCCSRRVVRLNWLDLLMSARYVPDRPGRKAGT